MFSLLPHPQIMALPDDLRQCLAALDRATSLEEASPDHLSPAEAKHQAATLITGHLGHSTPAAAAIEAFEAFINARNAGPRPTLDDRIGWKKLPERLPDQKGHPEGIKATGKHPAIQCDHCLYAATGRPRVPAAWVEALFVFLEPLPGHQIAICTVCAHAFSDRPHAREQALTAV